jgi:hypothetical protein
MNYNFLETPNTSGKVIDTITLTANDYFSFPTFFVEKHKLKELGAELYARLYFDKQNNAIAIQFVPEKQANLYKINVSPQYGATCKIKSFLLNNEIDTDTYAGKYEYKKHKPSDIGLEGQDVFVISLGNKKSESTEENEM